SLYTGAEEMLSGRVKTLHPKIHAGILALREDPEQMSQLEKNNIKPIDMVVVNLYPFEEVVKKGEVRLDVALENIDIGGPTMLRAAAKNFKNVAAVSSPQQYESVLDELRKTGGSLSQQTCFKLALEVFRTTAFYDSVIAEYFQEKQNQKIEFPPIFICAYRKVADLRYGENPHQKAGFYSKWDASEGTLPLAEKLGGKELSFNNILDFQAALNILYETDSPFAVVIKHNNPCGAAEAESLQEACRKAFEGDPVSAFGCILGLNRSVDKETASFIADPQKFVEGIVAPSYTQEALKILKEKTPWGRRLIILKIPLIRKENLDLRKIKGGILLQEEDTLSLIKENLKVVTDRKPTQREMQDLEFAWKICKYVKSNAILIAKDKMVVGVGAGQMSRIDAANLAIKKAKNRCQEAVLASDAFFPFPDVVEEAAKAGIKAIIQPGGALRDKEVIKAANKYKIAMVFTGIRHFLH
ncbi:bifunctional phosphoribosylaminoimidazolecarboxamide formyltransferase/IMP cyclohydrolase, partial [Candidatus Aerophobetes bacterium]|nr:bifunctional phosphoribosylaminoimidazolecarboxamide formyltransferase/IMP cyclohydrolase [Candidatus Aerophobetes bacterium]